MAGVGAVGALVGGVTGFMQSQYQAQVADRNAKVATWNAERARTRAGIDAQEKDFFETRALLGDQKVAQGASGVSLAGKSQVATRNTARILGRRDTENIIEEGRLQTHGHLVEAENFKAEKKAAKLSGKAGLIGSIFDAAGKLADMGSKVGTAKASPAQSKYPPKPVLKPVGFNPSRSKSPMGFTYPSFTQLKRKPGY